MHAMTSKPFLLFALLFSMVLIGYIFQDYLMSITIGAILTLATRPIFKLLYTKLDFTYKNLMLSSGLTLALFMLVFLPFIYFTSLTYQMIPNISVEHAMQYIKNTLAYLKDLPKPFAIFQEPINALLQEFNVSSVNIDTAKSILNNTAQFFFKINSVVYQFFFILFFYFLFNFYGSRIFMLITRILPLAKNFKRILYTELSNTVSSVFFSTIFSMVAQGTAFGLFIYAFTDYDAFYFGLSTAFATAIPVVGAYIIIIPLTIIEVLNHNYILAVSIIAFTIIVMAGVVDNILRLFFMRYLTRTFSLTYQLNEIFVLFAMLAGIGVFGGWGIIIAPALLSLSVAFIIIYLNFVRTKIHS